MNMMIRLTRTCNYFYFCFCASETSNCYRTIRTIFAMAEPEVTLHFPGLLV